MTAISRKTRQNLINHVALVLDASYSMDHLQSKVVEVTDELVKFLAKDSQEKDQETRVSIYTFADTVRCDIWDMDVLRLPSMKELYSLRGSTALIDATMQGLDDFDLITEKYGDHGFLMYVITDGQENVSKGKGANNLVYGRVPRSVLQKELSVRINGLQDNRTVVAFVPNESGVREVQSLGFPIGNIAVWDATTEKGLEQAAETIRTTAATYTSARSTGLRGSKTLLTLGGNVDAKAVKQKLTPLKPTEYDIVPVTKVRDKAFEKPLKKPTKSQPEPPKAWFVRIDDFINHVDPPFRIGKGYYQLFSGEARKSEKIQGNKQVAVMDKKTSKVYVGAEARQIIGLPDYDVTVKADTNPDYEIFVRSTSDNRHLPVGTKVLLLK